MLLNVEPGSLFDIPDVIKRRRKELLAQITLDGGVKIDNQEVDLSAAKRILADLDDANIKRHHERILRNDELHNFLRFGKCSGSMELPSKPLSFLKFLEPFLIEQISKALDRALKSGDHELISNLVNTKFTFQPDSWRKAFRPARRFFHSISQSLETKKSSLKETNELDSVLPPQCRFDHTETTRLANPFKSKLRIQPEGIFLDSLATVDSLECLNALPDAFQDLRNEIANGLDGMAVAIFNDLDEEEIAHRISERAIQIDVGAKDGERIRNNFKIISSSVSKRRISDASAKLKVIAAAIRTRLFDTPDEAISSVMTVFDVHSLNRLSAPPLNAEIIGLTKQVREIGWLLITSFNSVPAAVLLVQECMKVRLEGNNVQSALLTNLEETRTNMLASVDIFPGSKSRTEKSASVPRSQKTSATAGPSSTNRYAKTTHFGESLLENDGILKSLYKAAVRAPLKDNFKVLGFLAGFIVLAICVLVATLSTSVTQNTSVKPATPTPPDTTSSRPRPSNAPDTTALPSAAPNMARPKTGWILANSGERGLGKLEISNGLALDALVRLRNAASGKTVREIYVRSQERSSITGIGPGDYEVLFATGRNFVPDTKSFAGGGSYEKFDRVFTFVQIRESGGTRFTTAQITLNKVPYGNLSSSPIDSADFNR